MSDTHNKISMLFEIIRRYDAYILSTNTKASLILAFNTIILGGVLMQYSEIIKFFLSNEMKLFAAFLIFVLTISSLLSIFFVFKVVYPFFGSKLDDKNQGDSLIYFGSVSLLSSQEYQDKISRVSDENILIDLSSQANILASGLKQKMITMRHSINTITFSLFIILVLVLFRMLQ